MGQEILLVLEMMITIAETMITTMKAIQETMEIIMETTTEVIMETTTKIPPMMVEIQETIMETTIIPIQEMLITMETIQETMAIPIPMKMILETITRITIPMTTIVIHHEILLEAIPTMIPIMQTLGIIVQGTQIMMEAMTEATLIPDEMQATMIVIMMVMAFKIVKTIAQI